MWVFGGGRKTHFGKMGFLSCPRKPTLRPSSLLQVHQHLGDDVGEALQRRRGVVGQMQVQTTAATFSQNEEIACGLRLGKLG